MNVVLQGSKPVVIMLDPIIHTDECPWCGDITCECHCDEAGIDERERLLWKPFDDGLLTWDEVIQRFFGKAEV